MYCSQGGGEATLQTEQFTCNVRGIGESKKVSEQKSDLRHSAEQRIDVAAVLIFS